jgi:hypothetical protein
MSGWSSKTAIMRKMLTVTFLSVMFCVPALADQITLKNGDRLTGKIVKSPQHSPARLLTST